jgi:hypothetical protein
MLERDDGDMTRFNAKLDWQSLQSPLSTAKLQTFSVRPGRPHLVTNPGKTSTVFLVLQGFGEYDFVGLDEPSHVC